MTIFALSTGPGISGIAVIRISGENTKKVIQAKKNHRNYNSMIRIARVSGKKAYSREELQKDQKWKNAKDLIEKFTINPENLL